MFPHPFRNGHRVLMLVALLLAAGCDEPATAPSNSGSIALIIVSGNGQSGVVGRELPLPLVAKATNPNGSGIANLTVEFRVTSGGGSMYVVATTTTSKGLAQNYWTLGTSTTQLQTVEVRAILSNGTKQVLGTFTATPLPGPAKQILAQAGDGQVVLVGTPVPVAPAVSVSDQYGNPVPNLSVAFLVTSGGGSVTGAIQPTNAAGVATVGSWTLGTTAGSNTLTATATGLSGSPVTFTATGTAGAAATIALNAGDGQSATVGTAVAVAPSVIVRDANNNPVSGVSVTFAVASGGGSATGTSPATDASGIATVGSWTLGITAGSNTLTATATGLSGSPVTFTATGTAGAAATIALNAGDGQSATVGTAVAVAPSVIVRDANNNPVSGVSVTFAVASGGGSATGTSPATDASGIATVGSWTLGITAGSNTLTATATGLSGSPVTFTATGTAGAAATIALNAGDGQSATVGTAVAVAPSVIVRDANNNPVSGVSVTFAVASGGGSATGTSPATDASGIATVGSWTLGITAGSNTLTATATGLSGSPVTFNATARGWTIEASMPTPRYGMGVGVVNGVVYAVGGLNGSGYLGTVEAYDPATDSWSTRASMPTPRYGPGVGVVNGVVYAVGGSNGSGYRGTVEAYDPTTDTWSTRASMPTVRAFLGVGVVNGVLYAVGGYDGGNLGTVAAYDPATDSWSTKASMPTPRHGMGVGVVNGVLYAVGGYGNGNVGTVEAYDPATDSWSSRASMPTLRYAPGVGVVNGVLYAMGGNGNSGALGTVEAYHPATNSWSTGASMPTPRYYPGVGVTNGVLYVMGGNSNSGVLGTVEALGQ